MYIVEVVDIPKLEDIQDVPTDNPLEVYKVCKKMEVLCDKEHGIGISAVQAGKPWKLFLVKLDKDCSFGKKGEYGYFVNCDYEEVTDTQQVVSMEGCLSIRSLDGQLRYFRVKRFNEVRVTGFQLKYLDNSLIIDIVDQVLEIEDQGIVFQHEIDHQKAVLISDTGSEVFVY